MIKDVTDLEVYNLALDLLTPLYRLTNFIPPDHRKIKYQANEAAEKFLLKLPRGLQRKERQKSSVDFFQWHLDHRMK